MLLFDVKLFRDVDCLGGWGYGYDYVLLKNLYLLVFWFLFGGFDFINVCQVVEVVGVQGVDVLFGIEIFFGVKDVELIYVFVKVLSEIV